MLCVFSNALLQQDYALVTNGQNYIRTLNIHTKVLKRTFNLTDFKKVSDLVVFDKSIQLLENCKYLIQSKLKF